MQVIICLFCGAELDKSHEKFCSRSCKCSFQHKFTDLDKIIIKKNSVKRVARETRLCKICGEEYICSITSSRKLCYNRECLRKLRTSNVRSAESTRKANLSRLGKPHHWKAAKPIKKPNLSRVLKQRHKDGAISIWNKGLTKETDMRLKLIGEKISKATIGRPQTSSKGYGIGGCREDLGHFVRSRWEANVARIFVFLGVEYEYEKHRFLLEDCSYCPDFYIPKENLYIEVKGYLRDSSVLKKFVSAHPEINLKVVDGEVYGKLEKIFKSKIEKWESGKMKTAMRKDCK